MARVRRIDFKKLRAVVRAPIVIDLRNLLSEETVKQSDFIYCFIGGPRRHAFETASPQLDPKRPLLETARKTTDSDDLLEDSQRPSSARDRTGF
jgi:hypothetical protein